MNRLYYGDCLTIMREMGSATVDLIYLEPPFNSNRDYNAIYADETGRSLPARVEAFCDTWTLDEERERAIRAMPILLREAGVADEVAEFWRRWANALRTANPRMLAYLSYMVQRLLPMRTILRPSGSLYLHCDPTASHYIQIMMDAIFGHENFRGKVIWKRTSAHGSARRPGPVHDVILFYSLCAAYKWNPIHQKYDEAYLRERFKRGDKRRWKNADLTGAGIRHGEMGKPWRGLDVTAKGWHWAYMPDQPDRMDAQGRIYCPKKKGGLPRERKCLADAKGVPLQTCGSTSPRSTRKRTSTWATRHISLSRCWSASSKRAQTPETWCSIASVGAPPRSKRLTGSVVSGSVWTSPSTQSKRVAKVRLQERLGLAEGRDFTIEGVPGDIEGARDLWKRDKYHFQKWAAEQGRRLRDDAPERGRGH